ncbi:LamG-like jellyroll fold domain-containing protein [Streptomyces sp. NPDC088785]|uniref:LamG-like jellyroll fold domain-containing protein n=1 Tax=Streptomyces sp. NPDC088785 TaxID=3365897 RepID=UPI0037F7F5AF
MPLLVEAGWGGLVQYPSTITWTDITPFVDTVTGVTVTRGASDELSETQPGTATLTLDNADGRFTPGNSGSPYAPFVRRNAPIRVSAVVMPQRSGAAPYPLSMCGDDFDAGLGSMWSSVYGGATVVDGRVRIPMNPGVSSGIQSARQWSLPGTSLTVRWPTVPGANGSSSVLANFVLDGVTAGNRIGFQYNGLTGKMRCVNMVGFSDASSTDLTYSAIDHQWLRIRESGGTFYWETSSDGFGWTVRRSLATPSWAATDQLIVSLTTGRTGGTGDYTEYDLLGAKVRPRFWGTVNEWPIGWDGLYSKAQITATDLFKRLNKQPALKSMLAQEILAPDSNLLVYYPLTEDSTSTAAGDLSGTGAPALATVQAGAAGSGTLTLGSADGPPETGEQVAAFAPVSATAGKYLSVDMGPAVGQRMYNYLCLEAWFQTTTTGRCIFGIQSTDLVYQHLLSVAPGGGLQIEWTWDGTPLTVETLSGPTTMADGKWHHVVYDQGAVRLWVDGVLVDSAIAVPRTWEERVLHVGGYRGTRLWNGAIGHVAIVSSPSTAPDYGPTGATHYAAGMTGYAGETADARMTRLARYAGVSSVTIWGSTHDPIASQGPGGSSVVARMREVESTESGRLWAERDWYGLAYQSRDVRYNPSPGAETFTINYADLEPGISLADDDQKMVNMVEATRPGGATQRVSAPASVLAFGEYQQDLNILKTSDNSVLDAAYWLVSRYANPAPELREVPIQAYTMANYLDILDAEIGSYFSVYNLPAQATAPSMRVTVEGYTETIRDRGHDITFTTSASFTDSVWVLDDPVYGVLGSTTRLAY